MKPAVMVTFFTGMFVWLSAASAHDEDFSGSRLRVSISDVQRDVCSIWKSNEAQFKKQSSMYRKAALFSHLSGQLYRDDITDVDYVGENGKTRTLKIVSTEDGKAGGLYETGLYAAAFRDTNNQVVVVFRGSKKSQDWVRNLNVGGSIGDQHVLAEQFAQKMVKKYGRSNVFVTGHSRGGQLAAFASLATGVPAYAFNPSVMSSKFQDYIADKYGKSALNDSNVINFVAAIMNRSIVKLPIADPVTAASELFGSGSMSGGLALVFLNSGRNRVLIRWREKTDYKEGVWVSTKSGKTGPPYTNFFSEYAEQTLGMQYYNMYVSSWDLHSISLMHKALHAKAQYFALAGKHVDDCN